MTRRMLRAQSARLASDHDAADVELQFARAARRLAAATAAGLLTGAGMPEHDASTRAARIVAGTARPSIARAFRGISTTQR